MVYPELPNYHNEQSSGRKDSLKYYTVIDCIQEVVVFHSTS